MKQFMSARSWEWIGLNVVVMYAVLSFIAWARASMLKRRGGRFWSSFARVAFGSVSSDRSSWKMGHAISGSEAPRPAREAREMLD